MCDSVVNTQKLSLEINAKNTYINSNVVLATNLFANFLCKTISNRCYLKNLQKIAIVSYAKALMKKYARQKCSLFHFQPFVCFTLLTFSARPFSAKSFFREVQGQFCIIQ